MINPQKTEYIRGKEGFLYETYIWVYEIQLEGEAKTLTLQKGRVS